MPKTKKRELTELSRSLSRKTINRRTPEINVMTYNLCWGCMSANDKSQFDRTAEYLAVKCQRVRDQTKQHQCANNITQNIIAAFDKNTRTGTCDILALQEATNWRLIYDGLKNSKKKRWFTDCGYIHHQTKTETGAFAELCTLYNRNKFILKSAALGDIGNGRPFQIIRLWWREFDRELIVINLHNSHHGSAAVIYQALNATDRQKIITKISAPFCVDGGIITEPDNTHRISKIGRTLKSKARLSNNSDSSSDKEPFIIFLGDTNDHGKFKLWRGFNPLSEYPGSEGKVSNQSNKPPVKSCCAPVGNSSRIRTNPNQEDFAYGDYILATPNLRFLKNNIIPTQGINHDASLYPASDHLPVLSILTPTTRNKNK